MGTAGLTLSSFQLTKSLQNAAEQVNSDSGSDELLKLGIASYSLRHYDRTDTIRKIQQIGAKYVNIKSFHLPKEYSQEQRAAARREFEDAGLVIAGGGVIYLRDDDDDYMRERFEYARICGMPVMVIGPTIENLPRVEKFVEEYDIKVAIHNHGPGSAFPAPQDALELIKDMDPRVGICNDLGHTARTGVDVIESLELSGDRLFDIHLKDLNELRDGADQCIIGQGAMPVAAIFHKLIQMNYQGIVGLEYEIERENPMPGILRSFAYMRGVVDGLENMMQV